ncbi:Hypothetical protein, putative [Bodo saltans]|uniref:Uncharacterized protein n=1 Tax=Bodo saltans TaxID=75058 RepID=A0A0S4KHA1_BODSA|nr:Hypothetical protein, putative [Bodo saltans]|eukprot:CUI11717.1 Hypothetical protein, putative [Bodo saltans]
MSTSKHIRGSAETTANIGRAAVDHVTGAKAFPDEDQDFYCLQCLVPCSALSLLVGEHTNHPRRRIEEAYETAPTDIAREVAEFEHCVKHFAVSIEQRTAEFHAREAAIVERLNDVLEAIQQLHRDQSELEEEWASNNSFHDEDVQLHGSQLKELKETGKSLRRASDVWIELYEASLLKHRAGVGSAGGSAPLEAGQLLTPTLCQAACTDLESARSRLNRTLRDLDGSLDHFTSSRRGGGVRDNNNGKQQQRHQPSPHNGGGVEGQAHRSDWSRVRDEEGSNNIQNDADRRRHMTSSSAQHVGSTRAGIDRDALYWFQLQQQQRRVEDHQRAMMRTANDGANAAEESEDSQSPRHFADAREHARSAMKDVRREQHSSPSDSDEPSNQPEHGYSHRHEFVPSKVLASTIGPKASLHRHSHAAASPRTTSGGTNPIDAPPLLRQYYHLRSCLRDALATSQPSTLINTFVRCIRLLKEEARIAGLGDEFERIASADPEYALMIGDF